VKVGGIFDSSQGSRKQKPQPDRILTEAKLALAVPIGDTNIQAECSAQVNASARVSVNVLVPCFGNVILFPLVDQNVVEPLPRANLARRQAAFNFVRDESAQARSHRLPLINAGADE
jgi:hypothetical protein